MKASTRNRTPASARGKHWQLDVGCPGCGHDLEDVGLHVVILRCTWCGKAWRAATGDPMPEFDADPVPEVMW